MELASGEELQELGAAMANLGIPDSLQPVFQCGQPGFMSHVAAQVLHQLDAIKVHRFINDLMPCPTTSPHPVLLEGAHGCVSAADITLL